MGEDVLTASWPAVADAVPTARLQISRFAEGNGAHGDCLDAVRLATSEALTNVVVHAYPAGLGELHVTAAMAEGDLWVLVSDDGQGLQARSERAGLGLGLALIAQLCEEFAIVKRASGGTELRMRFVLSHDANHPVRQVSSAAGGSERTDGPGVKRGDSQLRAPA